MQQTQRKKFSGKIRPVWLGDDTGLFLHIRKTHQAELDGSRKIQQRNNSAY
jgi:hypothetical protein